MRSSLAVRCALVVIVAACVSAAAAETWKIHDRLRPKPTVIDPGTAATAQSPGRPPSDAVVLFDGRDMTQWRALDGGPARWLVKEGALTTVKGAGPIRSLRAFGDCQLHIEWATPTPPEGTSQGRGNSGVILMGRYEVQVLDSYENVTYADGQAAAIYAQAPPQVNASRRPGEWQSYDIVFHAPRFAGDGDRTVVAPARLTVFHNGVLVQDDVALSGPTGWMSRAPYEWHPERLPLVLQDHGNPVRFRNVWVRELPDADGGSAGAAAGGGAGGVAEIVLPPEQLERFVGEYRLGWGGAFTIRRDEFGLIGQFAGPTPRRLHALSETTFVADGVDLEAAFQVDGQGRVTAMVVRLAGEPMEALRQEAR